MKPRSHLRVEVLEDRSVPSTFAAFDLDRPDRGPFPSDRFTVADASQLTNRRINLPQPDASTRPSDYADVSVINTLDGFNLQPRLSISFSGPIDVTTVNSTTVFLVRLGDTDGDRDVDHADLDLMLSSFGKNQGDAGFLWFLDYEGDGDVDGLDMAQFNHRRGS